MKTFTERLSAEVAARTGVTIVKTVDEERLLQKCREVAKQHGHDLYCWRIAGGLECLTDPNLHDFSCREVPELFQLLLNWRNGRAIVVAADLISWINQGGEGGLIATRMLRNIVQQQQQLNHLAVTGRLADDGPQDPSAGVVQLVVHDTEELSRPGGANTIRLELPNRHETTELVAAFTAARCIGLDPDRIVTSLMGLPEYQQQQALLLSHASCDKPDPTLIQDYKRQQLQAKGITWVDPDPRGFAAVGGLEPLKQWLRQRGTTFDAERAAEYGVGAARGLVISGPPGTGKSMLVKALAAEWNCPLLRIDLGDTRGRFHGDSESAFQTVLDTLDAVCPEGSPGIAWFDEGDRALSGSISDGQVDGGVAAHVFQKLLVWMQERTSDCFIYMTANHPEQLPPELTRPERLDGCWWVNYPAEVERRAIIEINKRDFPHAATVDTELLVQRTENRTGAEIKAAFREAAIQAMTDGLRLISPADIVLQLEQIPVAADTYRVPAATARWREAAMKANNRLLVDLNDQQPDDRPGAGTPPRRDTARLPN